MRKLIVVLFSLLFPAVLYAAPSVTGATGTITSGNAITISGSGFGTKSPAAPYFYDNFDAGTDGVTVIGKGGTVGAKTYISYGGSTAITYTSTGAYNGKSVYKQSDGDDFSTAVIDGLNSQKMYYSINYKWSASGTNWGDSSTVFKPLRITGSSGYYSNYPAVKTQCQPFTSWCYDAYGSTNIADSSQYLEQNTWHRSEIYSTVSDVGAGNGTVLTWHDSVQNFNLSNAITRISVTEDDNYDSALLPMEIANNSEQTYTFYADDFYMDNTLARVELCAGSTWNSRGVCSIQIPTGWGTSSATATVNTGSFTTGQTAYLYVVDSTGAANANGYSVTINSGQADVAKPTTSTNEPSGRRTETKLVTLACTDDVSCSTKYCYGAGCTPTTTYSAPFPVLKNLAAQSYCVSSTDGANTETAKCFDLKKQIRR